MFSEISVSKLRALFLQHYIKAAYLLSYYLEAENE